MFDLSLFEATSDAFLIILFFLCFHSVSFLVEWVFALPFWPQLVYKSDERARRRNMEWRRKNTSISFVHSLVSGTWALTAFVIYPEMCSNIMYAHEGALPTLVLFSIGYFFYDAFDMVRNDPTRRTWELLIHHSISVVAFSLTILSHKLYAYAGVALLMEVNSVFLHIRVVINMHGCRKDSPVYRILSLVNISTFIVFRFFVIAWMTRWILDNRTSLNDFFYLVGTVGLAVMFLMNIFLFYRILVSDNFFPGVKREKLNRTDSGEQGKDGTCDESLTTSSKWKRSQVTCHSQGDLIRKFSSGSTSVYDDTAT